MTGEPVNPNVVARAAVVGGVAAYSKLGALLKAGGGATKLKAAAAAAAAAGAAGAAAVGTSESGKKEAQASKQAQNGARTRTGFGASSKT
jgi:methyl coenzyme M reductase alpha subunit